MERQPGLDLPMKANEDFSVGCWTGE
jgi:hypothetical protein